MVKYVDDDGYGLHEVHYEDGIPVSRTEDPSVVGDTPQSIIDQLLTMRIAARKLPVLNDKFWEVQQNAEKTLNREKTD